MGFRILMIESEAAISIKLDNLIIEKDGKKLWICASLLVMSPSVISVQKYFNWVMVAGFFPRMSNTLYWLVILASTINFHSCL